MEHLPTLELQGFMKCGSSLNVKSAEGQRGQPSQQWAGARGARGRREVRRRRGAVDRGTGDQVQAGGTGASRGRAAAGMCGEQEVGGSRLPCRLTPGVPAGRRGVSPSRRAERWPRLCCCSGGGHPWESPCSELWLRGGGARCQ